MVWHNNGCFCQEKLRVQASTSVPDENFFFNFQSLYMNIERFYIFKLLIIVKRFENLDDFDKI